MHKPIARITFVVPGGFNPNLHLTYMERDRGLMKDLLVQIIGPLGGVHGVMDCNLEELKAAIRFLESEMERAVKEEA